MASKTLSQVLSSLNSVYAPQVRSVQARQKLIPGEAQADIQQATAARDTAFGEILNGARRRGLGWSGLPLGEQAKYSADVFAPTVLRVQNDARNRATSLEEMIAQINERKYQMGTGIYQFGQNQALQKKQMAEQRRQFDLNLAEQKRQAAASRAAAANAFSPSYGSLDNPTQALAKQRKDKGYNFKDQFGNPISAAAYAAATGTPFRTLLQTMANSGDVGAKRALGFVGDDYGYNPSKIGKYGSLYNNLVWGTGRQYTPGISVSVARPSQRVVVR